MTNRHALLGALIILHFSSHGLWAENQPQTMTKMPSIWEQDCLTGDWDGTRTKMADHGVVFGLNITHDLLGNPSGGIRRAIANDGCVDLSLDLDFQKMTGLEGSFFHINSYYIYGDNLSAGAIGNAMTVSNIEAYNSLRLYDLWYQQEFLDGKVSLRIGQLAADDEFLICSYGQTFLNGTFTWAPLTANNLPSGGPGYPLATPGIRLKIEPIEQVCLMAAVFDGDPGDSPGTNNPQKRDASGTRIDFNQGALGMFEAAYLLNQEKDAKGLPGTYTLGGFYATQSYPDERIDNTGLSLADPASSGVPRNHSGNWGIYFMANQMIWRESTPEMSHDPKDMKQVAAPDQSCGQSLGLFWRIGGTPSDRNTFDFYTDGGLNYTGLFPGRNEDVLGLGVAYARISSDLAQLDRDDVALNGTTLPIESNEMAIELTYLAKIAPWWTIQPDAQYIIHPGGEVPDPDDASNPIPNAVVLGVRTTITF